MTPFSLIYLKIWSDDIGYYSIRLKMFEKGLFKMMAGVKDSKSSTLTILSKWTSSSCNLQVF